MKDNIHPIYHQNVIVTCSCGNSFVTGSTAESLRVEICSQCHPLFTGKAKIIDTAGRVDKFKARVAKAEAFLAKTPKKSKKVITPPTASGELVIEAASLTAKGDQSVDPPPATDEARTEQTVVLTEDQTHA